uniref:Aminotransferase class I/classII large domain-containing protein n=2 Tax=Spongospora subterranea TaxID=70186 RepID=A0A0H5QKI3_9EUKA|eukprot:CRZ01801.1 hypothetical protein [Spongospora subterranea]
MATPSVALSLKTLNANVLLARYAVRSEIAARATVLARRLDNGDVSLPFKSIISCNIGNPHALLGQKPLTYIRQVLSLCVNPDLLLTKGIFPLDTIKRAKQLLATIPGGVGAYSNSQGLECVRSDIAAFLRNRDAVDTSIDEIYCTKGASEAVKMTLECLIRNGQDGVLVPVPQYPLYSATLTCLGGQTLGYYLDEDDQWSQSKAELTRAYNDAVSSGIKVRALVIINPGNPTGQVLDRKTLESTIEFCAENNLVLMADEVYADNVYAENCKFFSCRRVAYEMGVPVQMVSYNSISKGFTGECGLRGGYMHLWNFDKDVMEQMTKLASMSLCSNTIGQLAMALHLAPPRPNEPSYELYISERDSILSSLKNRAMRISEAFNRLDGMSCTIIQGAMYAFPRVNIPQGAVVMSKSKGYPPDELYVRELLEETGVVCVAGSGFLQKDGTYHFRITILPPEDQIDQVIQLVSQFHARFMKRYS